MMIYDKLLGLKITKFQNAALKTLEFPFKIVAPFLVMIIASLLTKPNNKAALDRLYVKMKTPVDPNPEKDKAQVERSYAQPDRFDGHKLFPGSSFEFQRPSKLDFWGVVGCFIICFGIIGIAILVSKIGS